MSTTGGAFNETLLQNIRIEAERIMMDDRIKQQFIPQIEIFNAISAVQTATITPLTGSTKKNVVELMWQNTCDMEVEDNVSCEAGGTKSSTNTKEYTIDNVKVVNFSASEADFIDNEYSIESAIAKQILRADKLLVEWAAQFAVGRINTNLGVNAVASGAGKTVSGNATFILPNYWDATLAAYFTKAAVLNRFNAPVFLSGQNLYEPSLIARYNSGNGEGKGEAAMFAGMKMYWDLFNIDSVNDPYLATYMLNTGSVALVSKNYFPDGVQKYESYTRYTMPSRFVPQFKYDVIVKDACEGDDDGLRFDYKIKLNMDLLVNPTGCDETNTGLLAFICGSVPSN